MADLKDTEKATFGAGCFWGVEASFKEIPGVISTSVGYTGGSHDNPSYESVCTGRTGHAEAVEVIFDPALVSYARLLDVFWKCHDPTTSNRQGPDVGTQYRSAIFFYNTEQEQMARDSMDFQQRSGRFSSSIVTEIYPATIFHLAEDYHQQYLEKRGMASCH